MKRKAGLEWSDKEPTAANGHPWRRVSSVIALQVATNVAGAAAGGGVSGAIVTNALSSILQNKSEHLDAVSANIRALVEGPYNAGMVFLEEANAPHRSGRDQRDFITKARDKFIEAYAQERDQFRKAQIEYEIGNCWTLLGSNEDAKIWFQKAHASALKHLHEKSRAARSAMFSLVTYDTFEREAFPVLDFLWNLERLKNEAPDLSLELPTIPTTRLLLLFVWLGTKAVVPIKNPPPEIVSRELLTRDFFKPAFTINLLAAGWFQFMIRSSFGNERSKNQNSWWDWFQPYSDKEEKQYMVRTGESGKLKTDPYGSLLSDRESLYEPGSWLGLTLLQNLFTLEHNAICDNLQKEHPSWTDDDLFDRARHLNSMLMAKVYLTEWASAIYDLPVIDVPSGANWLDKGIEQIYKIFGRVRESEAVNGILRSYAMTKEFVAVYPMHAFIPDEYTFRSVADDTVLREVRLPEVGWGRRAEETFDQIAVRDIFYSFGIAHPGAITLHNYTHGLQHFESFDGTPQDVAATDILRIRALGVPRYNEFRKLLHLKPIKSFEKLTDDPEWVAELKRVYDDRVDQLDLMIGMCAEDRSAGSAFGYTAAYIFILLTLGPLLVRIHREPLLTSDLTDPAEEGLDWIDNNNMSTVLLRHYPELDPALRGVSNAFSPWNKVPSD
jgi:hypothetical protein